MRRQPDGRVRYGGQVVCLVVAGLLLGPIPHASGAVMCDGVAATIVGTPGDDTLTATTADDVIAGLGGNDTITGLRRIDVACAGPGNDTVTVNAGGQADGEDGNDRLVNAETSADFVYSTFLIGGPGDDTLLGGPSLQFFEPGPGEDVIDGRGAQPPGGGPARSTLYYFDAPGPVSVNLLLGYANGEGRDTIVDLNVYEVVGSAYPDLLVGDNLDNALSGGNNEFAGDGGDVEILVGLGGADRLDAVDFFFKGLTYWLLGGPGDDILDGRLASDDTLSGGTGTDLVFFGNEVASSTHRPGAGVTVDLAAGTADGELSGQDRLGGVENVAGTSQADVLIGDDGPNQLAGYGGDDTIVGNGGNDQLFGGVGSDAIDGGPGNDLCTSAVSAVSCER